jgi:CRISPR-associated endonuclease/helicase Cas3
MDAVQARIAPWGKLDRSAPDLATASRLSLVGHCIDVAAVTRALIDLPTWRRRLQTLAGRVFTPHDLDRLTVLAFLHDVGKAGAGFYSKGLPPTQQAAWLHRSGGDRSQLGHTRVVAPLLGFDSRFQAQRDALGMPALRAWAEASGQESLLDLWLAAVSHHGEPISAESLRDAASGAHPTWTRAIAGYDPVDGLAQLREAAQALWPGAYAAGIPPLAASQGLIHAFAGLVSLADWIGSSTDFFPYDLGPQDQGRWAVSLPRARQALRDMRIDLELARADLRERSPDFRSVFGFTPKAMQSATADPSLPSPVVLEAETGSGKTEAALWRFKALFEAGEVDALCFLLPTRVAATGISARLEGFVQRLFPDPVLRPNTVLAVPGYLHANGEDGTRLAPFTVHWPDNQGGAPLFWAAEHSKRYFAASAAAATIDQFLLSTLQTKHAHLRGSVLLRSLVVVDEVHASDPYMRALLVRALQRHLAAGGHALLLSATLTRDLRDELLRTAPGARAAAAKRGLGRGVPQPPAPVPAESVAECDYPRITAPGHVCTVGPITDHKRIQRQLLPLMREPAAVAALAIQAVHSGARVLVLRNTVRQAVATQQALEAALGLDHPSLFRCAGIAALHHGRYAFPDRQALDLRVGELFGKGAVASRQAVVLCATQTVEISVDCDADFMITDLAPMDVLLQRLGRLHRHAARDEHRALDHRQPRCVVLTPPVPDAGNLSTLLQGSGARGLGLGARSAYPDVLCLQATLLALMDEQRFPVLDIPQDNRALVERACAKASLQALAEALGGSWLAHRQALQGLGSAQASAALYQCIDWLQPWREAVPGELSPEAKTRLGLDGVQLQLPDNPTSPFGHALTELTLPVWMLPPVPGGDRAELPEVENLRAEHQRLRFTVLGRSFVYDRHGLSIDAAAGTPSQ